MVEYPTEEQIIDLNKKVLKTIKDKKADRHRLLSKAKITRALKATKNMKGDIYDKAAVMLYELLQFKGHAFESGNRRTAYLTTKIFLEANGKTMEASHDERVLQGIREGFYSMSEIKEWLMGNEIRPFNR